MTFQNVKSDSNCVGGRHRFSTVKIFHYIISKVIKKLIGHSLVCNRKELMNVSENTIQAEGLTDFFKNLGKKFVKVGKKLAKIVFKNPFRPLDITANIATAAADRSLKNVLSALPEMVDFYHIAEGLYLG